MTHIRSLFRLLIAFAFAARAVSFAAAPAITQQPTPLSAAPGEDISFSVTATGDAPLAYQWRFNEAALAGETNSLLSLTNVTVEQSGGYSVTITNAAGSTNSAIVSLNVTTNAFRQIGTGNITQSGTTVSVPVLLFGNLRENAVSFSLAYATNVFSNPTFTADHPTATVTTDTATVGVVGVAIVLPPGEVFNSTNRQIGSVTFDLGAGQSPYGGALAFVAEPNSISGVTADGVDFEILAAVAPHFERIMATPVLRLQSGLFEQQILVANPAGSLMTNVTVLPIGLGVDSRTNVIRLYNAHFSESVIVPNLAPGEARTLTMEYYVADHVTVPNPDYLLALTDRIELSVPVTAAKELAIDRTRSLTNGLIVEFSTQLARQYFVQYAPTAEGLSTGKVAFPAIIGTGSRVQWIDNGPPKTDSPPTNQTRFYRILSDER